MGRFIIKKYVYVIQMENTEIVKEVPDIENDIVIDIENDIGNEESEESSDSDTEVAVVPEPKKKSKKTKLVDVLYIAKTKELKRLEALEIKRLAKEAKKKENILDGRQRGGATRKIAISDSKKKAELFDQYLAGTLTYESILLAGYKIHTPEVPVPVVKAPVIKERTWEDWFNQP